MQISDKDAKTIDILLVNYQKSASITGNHSVYQTLGELRKRLAASGGTINERLAMDIQIILSPILEDDSHFGPPETIKARVKEIFQALDNNRTNQ